MKLILFCIKNNAYDVYLSSLQESKHILNCIVWYTVLLNIIDLFYIYILVSGLFVK